MKNIIYVFLAATLLATSIAKGSVDFPVMTAKDTMYPEKLRGDLLEQKARIELYKEQAKYLEKISQEELKRTKLQNEMYERVLQNQSKPIRTKGGTHYVRPYIKKNGTYVQGHLSGNPGSGVHCHKNVCY